MTTSWPEATRQVKWGISPARHHSYIFHRLLFLLQHFVNLSSSLSSNNWVDLSRVRFNSSLDILYVASQTTYRHNHLTGAKNTQPSEPITWLILTKLNIIVTINNTITVNDHTTKLLTCTNKSKWNSSLVYRPFIPCGQETDPTYRYSTCTALKASISTQLRICKIAHHVSWFSI